ncbi:sensor histidine kinase [Rathayibacter sp. YIM 133350]|uniref:sensor histidine kinase n=1 Tax=Rathayibacter sp. YIM 133350 TaxID=3131992 RepID=UPI00307F7CC0
MSFQGVEHGWGAQPRQHGWGGPPPAIALVAPVALSVATQAIAIVVAVRFGNGVGAWLSVLALLASGLLLGSRRFPGAVALTVAIACAPAVALCPGPPFAAIPVAFGVLAAGARGRRQLAWSSVGAFAAIGIGLGLLDDGAIGLIRPLIAAFVVSMFVAFGEALRERRQRYRALSLSVAAQRAADAEAERLRIARELHDVLAHSLSQISVQAGVGLHLFDSTPEQARASLAAIRSTSVAALDEVRAVLGVLRSDGEPGERTPAPGLSRLPALIEQFRSGGLAVRFDDGLTDDPPPAVQSALFRVIQESLTNVVRHAGATTATVSLERRGDEYVVQVEDDGVGGVPAAEGGGLTGMRERIGLLNGSVEVTPGSNGGLRVSARIPVTA